MGLRRVNIKRKANGSSPVGSVRGERAKRKRCYLAVDRWTFRDHRVHFSVRRSRYLLDRPRFRVSTNRVAGGEPTETEVRYLRGRCRAIA